MKKMFTTLVLSGLSIATFAQGYINWSGSSVSLIVQTNGTVFFWGPSGGSNPGGTVGNTVLNNAVNNAALGYPGYYYELLTSTTATAAPTTVIGFSAWADTGLGATNNPIFSGRLAQVNGGATVGVNNWPVGATQAIVLVGWSANLGSSWATVLSELQNWAVDGGNFVNATYFGVSSFGSGIQAVASTASGNQVIGAGTGEIYNPAANPMQLELLSTPEPASMALAAIGGASLLLFRRRK